MSYVEGASASIMKTIREIEAIIQGDPLGPAGPKRRRLRNQLVRVITESSVTWYRRGFRRGHREAYREFKTNDRVPIKLTSDVSREFLPNTNTDLVLTSRLSREFRQGISP